ncbi:MAG: hypothetical protein ACI90V_011294 [Bacillariaceae sp.]|jgi:hypothetical protein
MLRIVSSHVDSADADADADADLSYFTDEPMKVDANAAPEP